METYDVTLYVPINSIGPVTLWCRKHLREWRTVDETNEWLIIFDGATPDIIAEVDRMSARLGVVVEMKLNV